MGWHYKYIILPQTSIEALKSIPELQFKFEDMTSVNNRLETWECDAQKQFMKGSVPKQPSPEVQRYDTAVYSKDLLIYTLWFYKIANQTVMMYTSTQYDPEGVYFFVALSHLYAFGYRGSVFLVSGNSITDTLSVTEYLIQDHASGTKVTSLNNWASPEGKYREFMQSELPALQLDKIHEYLLNSNAPLLVIGKYLHGKDNSSKFKSLMTDIGVVLDAHPVSSKRRLPSSKHTRVR